MNHLRTVEHGSRNKLNKFISQSSAECFCDVLLLYLSLVQGLCCWTPVSASKDLEGGKKNVNSKEFILFFGYLLRGRGWEEQIPSGKGALIFFFHPRAI